MAKFRKRVKGKSKVVKKGYSASSNPATHKHREAAKSRFFQPLTNPGDSNLTFDAIRKHDTNNDTMEDDVENFDAKTYKTFDTWDSQRSILTNQSFTSMVEKFRPDNPRHRNLMSILAAVTEVINEKDGKQSTTEYFGALMTSLLNPDLDDDTVSGILTLLSACIKSTPPNVLQIKFSEASSILLNLLSKYSESNNVPILRAILGCISVLLRAQEPAVWNDPSTLRLLQSILAFVTFSKPKIRKAAQHGIAAIMMKSKITNVGLSQIAQHCIAQVESVVTGGITATLQILTLLKDIMHLFPKKELKICCEAVLKIMTLNNVLVTSCGLGALHSMFAKGPKNMSPTTNARLLNALYDFQPPSVDTQPTQAWLIVMQEAYICLSKSDVALCAVNLPKIYKVCAELYLCKSIETVAAVTRTLQSVTLQCLDPVASKPGLIENVRSVIEIVESYLSYQYHSIYKHVLHVIGVCFTACKEQSVSLLVPILKTMGELRDGDNVMFINELDSAIGNAVRALGPQNVLKAIPLQIFPGNKEKEFKRSWLLPILKENIKASTLSCFINDFLPQAVAAKTTSEKFKANNDQIRSLSYDLYQSQIWSLLPSFSNQPSDISSSFPTIAKALGNALSGRKDLRLTILSCIRRLIIHSLENKNPDDVACMAKYAKNYLPIMFNIYTTKVSGTDDEGARLATLETIKVYLKVSDNSLLVELFERSLNKLQSPDTNEFVKECVLDLLKSLMSYQTSANVSRMYDLIIKSLSDTSQNNEQKKYYRLLEEIFISESEGCKIFLKENLAKIKEILLDSFKKASANSKGARLSCIFELLKNSDEDNLQLSELILPETILCLKDINNRCRENAYKILEYIYNSLEMNSYLHIIMAGLGATPALVSCSLLALAALVFHKKDQIDREIEEQILYNVGLLMVCSVREIVSSAMSFIKVYLTSYPRDKVEYFLPKLIKLLSNMTEDCKRHNRTKTRDMLSRLVRWYGADTLISYVPGKDEILRTRIRNLGKINSRKIKKRKEDKESKSGMEDDMSMFSVAGKHKTIEEILAESDSDIDSDEGEEKNTKKKNRKNTYITEEAEEILDFTDVGVARKISGTLPGSLPGISNEKQKKKKENPFKTAPDGRLIISEPKEMSDDEDETKKKKKKRPVIPDDDYEDSDDDWMTMGGQTEIGKKRALSVGSQSYTPKSKYRAGGSGIHRPISRAASIASSRKSNKQKGPSFVTGDEYKAKKAKGDLKLKGRPDPYAYIPLRKDALNKRKRMKNMAQMKNILKAAKKGAIAGSKIRSKKK